MVKTVIHMQYGSPRIVGKGNEIVCAWPPDPSASFPRWGVAYETRSTLYHLNPFVGVGGALHIPSTLPRGQFQYPLRGG